MFVVNVYWRDSRCSEAAVVGPVRNGLFTGRPREPNLFTPVAPRWGMEHRGHVLVGGFVVLMAVASIFTVADSALDVAANVGFALGGLFFVLAGFGRPVEVGGMELQTHHYIGIASVLVALSILPTTWESFVGDTTDRVYGAATGLAAAALIVLGYFQFQGRFENARRS